MAPTDASDTRAPCTPARRTGEPGTVSVFIMVAVRLYREGLAATLNRPPGLCVTGSAGTGPEAQAALGDGPPPDVIIVDVSLGDVHALMRGLRERSPHSRILAFAVGDDVAAILEYAAAGAEGFFTANGSVADLVQAIERTAAGELLCSPRMAAQLLRQAAQRPQGLPTRDGGPGLTGREQQVYSLLRQGRSNKQIAGALHIAEATVKNHVHHLLEKLQVSTRGQAAAVGTGGPAGAGLDGARALPSGAGAMNPLIQTGWLGGPDPHEPELSRKADFAR